ncbi:hypothetical protein B8W95_12950, partial [Staphylococcus pasteuri]
ARFPRRTEIHHADQVVAACLSDSEQPASRARSKLGFKVVGDQLEELDRLRDLVEEEVELVGKAASSDEFLGDVFEQGVVRGERFPDLGAPRRGRFPRGAGER